MKCAFIKPDKDECRANALHKDKYCFTHSAKSKKERKEANLKGGLAPKRNQLDLPPFRIKNTDGVVGLLEDTINRVRAGEIEVRVANCLGFLSGHILKAFEISDLEKRLSELEKIIKQKEVV